MQMPIFDFAQSSPNVVFRHGRLMDCDDGFRIPHPSTRHHMSPNVVVESMLPQRSSLAVILTVRQQSLFFIGHSVHGSCVFDAYLSQCNRCEAAEEKCKPKGHSLPNAIQSHTPFEHGGIHGASQQDRQCIHDCKCSENCTYHVCLDKGADERPRERLETCPQCKNRNTCKSISDRTMDSLNQLDKQTWTYR